MAPSTNGLKDSGIYPFSGFMLLLLQIKLVNIRPEDIVEGNGKLTLGLIWTIILNFQVSVIKRRQLEENLLRSPLHNSTTQVNTLLIAQLPLHCRTSRLLNRYRNRSQSFFDGEFNSGAEAPPFLCCFSTGFGIGAVIDLIGFCVTSTF